MTVTNIGKNRIKDLTAADIDQSTFGTGDTSPQRSDTDLTSEDTATQNEPNVTASNLTISVTGIMPSTIGNGNTYNEHGIRMNNGSVLLTKQVFPDFVKNDSLELHVTEIITWV